MSFTLETLNRGPVEDFGFYGPDITRVRLSNDLPPLSLEQFCQFSTQVLIDTYKNLDLAGKAKLKELLLESKRFVAGLRVRPSPRAETKEVDSSRLLTGLVEGVEVRKVDYSGELKRELSEALASNNEISPELGERLASAFSEAGGYISQNRLQGPFEFSDGVIKIENLYEVDPIEFTYFSRQIMVGGIFGWGDYGIPECAASAINTLVQEVSE